MATRLEHELGDHRGKQNRALCLQRRGRDNRCTSDAGPREQSHGVAGKDTGGEPVEPEEREERPKQREQEEEPRGRSLQQG